MRNRSTINAVDQFFRGFNQSYDTVGRVLKDIDLAKVHSAKVEDAGQTLEVDDPNKTTTLPGIDGAPPTTMRVASDLNLKKRSTLLGEEVDPNNTEQIDRVRQRKVADVLGKYDPAEGMRMRRELKADERADWAHGRERKRADREDKAYDKEQAYEQGRNQLFASTRFGRNQVDYAKQLQAWKASGGQGQPPARPAYTVIDAIGDQAMLLDYDATHGKLDTKGFAEFSQRLRTMQDEGYEKALRQAHAGAPLPQVLELFNAAGQERFSPEDVAKDERATGPDGVATRRITMRDGTVIDTLAALDSLGKAGEVFARHYKAKDDKRDDRRLALDGQRVANEGARVVLARNQDQREQQVHDAGKDARETAMEVARLQSIVLNSKDPAEIKDAEARLTKLQTVKNAGRGRSASSAYKFDGGEISAALGTPAVDARGRPITDPMTGRQVVNRNPDEEAKFAVWMQQQGMTDSNEALPKYLAQRASGGAGGDLLAQARDAVAKGADKAKVNERLRAQGLPPLP